MSTPKIAVEEHWTTPEHSGYLPENGLRPDVRRRAFAAMADVDDRLEVMDRHGIDVAVLSLGAHGIQGVPDARLAVDLARRGNDLLAEAVARHPERYVGLAAVALQDPAAAAAELERAVRELGFRGACVNGFTDVGDTGAGEYYDAPRFAPFWERLEALDVPLYLHPRSPLATSTGMYEGHPELTGPTWGWGVETATHALRLITSGLFDRHPGATVVLGHLGETLPFALNRMQKRLLYTAGLDLAKPAAAYLRDNFYLTTSGNFHTPSLLGTILEVGADRVMFAVDYPFEGTAEAVDWWDTVPISAADRAKIERGNAERVFGL